MTKGLAIVARSLRDSLSADMARYPRRPWLKEPSFWAIFMYRFGRWIGEARPRGARLLDRIYWLALPWVDAMSGISLPRDAEIGPGLRIEHFGGIFISPGCVIGRNCTLRQNVTLGVRRLGGPSPVVGDDVEFGSGAHVLGDVRIGRGAQIGAMTLVLTDVPALHTAIGNPARILPPREDRP